MSSRKKIEDLEYNVYKKHLSGTEYATESFDSGCFSVFAAVIVLIVIIAGIIAFMQINKNGPSPSCATLGCTNKVRPGSNYCWLHSSSYKGRNGSNNEITPNTPSSKGNSTTKSDKIWGGSTGRHDAPQSGSLIN